MSSPRAVIVTRGGTGIGDDARVHAINYEDALADADFLIGTAVSLADVALVAYTRWAHEGGFDLGAFPAVRGWIGRVETALNITEPGL